MISVIIPAYNAEKVILNAVKSVLDGYYEDVEVLVVDDGSKDNTAKVVERLSKIDCRVRLIRKENGGVSSARNIGIEAANGDIIMFLDSDDTFEVDYCACIAEKFASENSDIVMAGYREVFDGHTSEVFCPINKLLSSQDAIYKKMILDCYCSGINGYMGSVWLAGYKKEIIDNNYIRFNISLHHSEDKLFLMAYLFCCQRMSVINKALYNYYLGDSSVTKNYSPTLKRNNIIYTEELNRLFIENGRIYPEEARNRGAVTEVISVILNETRANNPNSFLAQIKTVYYANQGLKDKIKKYKPINKTLKIKKMIASYALFSICFYCVRRIQRAMEVYY